MKLKACVVGAAALFCLVSTQSADATPLTYNWDPGTSFSFSDGATAHFTGSFTINPPNDSLTGTDIVITGGTNGEAGTYVPLENDFASITYVFGRDLLEISFGTYLEADPAPQDPMLGVVVGDQGYDAVSVSVSGGAQLAVPEPASLALFVPALLALGFLVGRKHPVVGQSQSARQWRSERASRHMVCLSTVSVLVAALCLTSCTSSAPSAPAGGSGAAENAYLKSMQQHIKLTGHPSFPLQISDRGTAVVQWTMTRDGVVRDANIEKSSGSERIDTAALEIIRSASPMPIVPDWKKGDSFSFSLPIILDSVFPAAAPAASVLQFPNSDTH